MRYRVPFLAALLVSLVSANGGEQYARVSELQPELKQALVRDAACSVKAASTPDVQDGSTLLNAPVATQEILAAGREAGVIAAPHDSCHCVNENCSTFVYLRSDGDYKLALHDTFASLRPMKVAMHGLPSLSGKYQVNANQEETTVFNWNGRQYEPGLCATVTRRNNQKVPSIATHPCKK
ncbi:MAG TPA: hypothetical protein VFR08_12790 [Candidatus Angelobacter sp.]|nr:hypothetical protein [Candidatus Angelobacter sp.]